MGAGQSTLVALSADTVNKFKPSAKRDKRDEHHDGAKYTRENYDNFYNYNLLELVRGQRVPHFYRQPRRRTKVKLRFRDSHTIPFRVHSVAIQGTDITSKLQRTGKMGGLQQIPLQFEGDSSEWVAPDLYLPPGEYKFRFVINDTCSMHSEYLPILTVGDGIAYNYFVVIENDEVVEPAVAADAPMGQDSPLGARVEYTNEILPLFEGYCDSQQIDHTAQYKPKTHMNQKTFFYYAFQEQDAASGDYDAQFCERYTVPIIPPYFYSIDITPQDNTLKVPLPIQLANLNRTIFPSPEDICNDYLCIGCVISYRGKYMAHLFYRPSPWE
ncbi:uncharacterized protein KNAG_0B03690 [Huiozyma naganishii CBS 8797]|uniref:Association with the SNF1 complex (ASC) domain-containing protein n=1 Tax=Huiozyma naganishii (strain ATCC MYA-139 / BCRC 22969 / CBS 8797 / KCTC 17520 / NBRC 10181 / NCYC 3082 / Yp74L-3) TaxID=1071383 RepID=J7S4U5_HUIN7|nr:hypothetical protein KNAG_0B03690 [Kazachstania naganishii CBS 8797]CCK68811.1 hypothetical protein KNAG_0B03690 [Kazachstania naganishii CBS 8797]